MTMEQKTNGSEPRLEQWEELLKVQKKMLLHTRITTLFNILLSVVLLVAVVMTIRWTNTKIEHMENSLTEIDRLVDDAGVLIDNTNAMVTENADAVAETVQKLNEVDFAGLNDAIGYLNTAIQEVDIEGLNDAINDLRKAIQPLTKLADLF